jgi:hypothetical protein
MARKGRMYSKSTQKIARPLAGGQYFVQFQKHCQKFIIGMAGDKVLV